MLGQLFVEIHWKLLFNKLNTRNYLVAGTQFMQHAQ